jgi:hypothetical protein
MNPQKDLGVQFCFDLYAERLRLLTVRKPAPAIAAISPATISHSTFAPVVASFGVVVAAGVVGGVEFESVLD